LVELPVGFARLWGAILIRRSMSIERQKSRGGRILLHSVGSSQVSECKVLFPPFGGCIDSVFKYTPPRSFGYRVETKMKSGVSIPAGKKGFTDKSGVGMKRLV